MQEREGTHTYSYFNCCLPENGMHDAGISYYHKSL